MSAKRPEDRARTYDSGKRRLSARQGRQRGCSIYISADELIAAGFDPDGPRPYYRTWGTPRGGVFVRLYKQP